jgi:hypothetical protein
MVTVPNRSCKAMKHDAKTGERMKCAFTHRLFTPRLPSYTFVFLITPVLMLPLSSRKDFTVAV